MYRSDHILLIAYGAKKANIKKKWLFQFGKAIHKRLPILLI